jgi:hypothetical protein
MLLHEAGRLEKCSYILSAINVTAPGNMKKSRAILSDLRTDVPSSHHSLTGEPRRMSQDSMGVAYGSAMGDHPEYLYYHCVYYHLCLGSGSHLPLWCFDVWAKSGFGQIIKLLRTKPDSQGMAQT